MTNANANASINTQVYESVGGMIFNYINAFDMLNSIKDVGPTELFALIIDFLESTDNLGDYYLIYKSSRKSEKEKYNKLMEYISEKKPFKKIMTSAILLKYLIDFHFNKQEIKSVLWNGEFTTETTADIILILENNYKYEVS
jgi:hypothetical protein